MAIVSLLSLPILAVGLVRLQAVGDIYSVENAPQQQAALVLGAAVHGTELTDILADRVDTAIELYEAEKVDTLVMSGAEHEAYGMKLYAMEKGVPELAIVEDSNGLNTLLSVQNLQKDERSLIIVTQKYHLPRALYIANQLGIEAVGVESDRSEYTKIREFKRREWAATSWIAFYLLFVD